MLIKILSIQSFSESFPSVPDLRLHFVPHTSAYCPLRCCLQSPESASHQVLQRPPSPYRIRSLRSGYSVPDPSTGKRYAAHSCIFCSSPDRRFAVPHSGNLRPVWIFSSVSDPGYLSIPLPVSPDNRIRSVFLPVPPASRYHTD